MFGRVFSFGVAAMRKIARPESSRKIWFSMMNDGDSVLVSVIGAC